MPYEKHTPETLTELLERAKTLHINEGLGRKRDEITQLLDQCLEIADFEPYKPNKQVYSGTVDMVGSGYTITTVDGKRWGVVDEPELNQRLESAIYEGRWVQAAYLRDHAEAEEV